MAVQISLSVIFLAVLLLPFFVHKIEQNLEVFLFIMGIIVITVTSQWSEYLVLEALAAPIWITLAVLLAGFIFYFIRPFVGHFINIMISKVGIQLVVLFTILILSALSSFITAIIASLILVEIISSMDLGHKDKVRTIVFSCFAIGMGAILTPLGEPLATIAISKLRGPPHNADFWYLARLLWPYIISGIVVFSCLAAFLLRPKEPDIHDKKVNTKEKLHQIFVRAAKTYLFIMALVFLGSGFKPLIDSFIIKLPVSALYWINSISAVLDNATLAAAQLSPSFSDKQVLYSIMALVISGGMLIPGNIPNILAASKLSISSKDWAKYGLPFGLASMALVYIFLITVKGI